MRTRRTWGWFIAALAVALVAVVGFVPRTALAADGNVAKIGEEEYRTLAEAFDHASDGNIILLTDVSDVVVPKDTTATIDLNGKTISAISGHAITNNGTLTIIGSGTVDGGTVGGKGALYTADGATTHLKGGTYTGGSWYVVQNHGTMSMDGITLKQEDAGSSAIDNGYPSGAPATDPNISLTIESGTFSGGMNIVKNDDWGNLTINGGTFTNTDGPTVLNWHKATINGGEFTGNKPDSNVISNGHLAGGMDEGQLVINGGTFTASSPEAPLFGYGVGGAKGGALEIKGGTFTGIVDATGYPYTPVISGGTFSSASVIDYLATGYSVGMDDSGSLTVARGGAFAVGADEYPTLDKAVAAASDGATITMLKDTVTNPVVVNKGITLDLGGHTLSLTGKAEQDDAGITFTNGASTIKNGSIVDTCQIARTFAVVVTGQDTALTMENAALTVEVPKSKDGYGMRVLDGAELTLNDGAVVNSASVSGNAGYIYGITVYGSASGAVFDEETATKLTVNEGARVEAYAFAVSGNGDGKKDNTLITINGGKLVSEAGPAIYHPQYGKLVINGGTLEGCSGVEIRAGELTVNGGTIKGDTSKTIVYPKDKIGGSNSVDGGGIIVAQHSTKLPVKVTVNGGTIEANTAFIQHNVMENDQASIDKIETSVTGGEFVGALRSDNFKDVDGKGFVSGGSFSDRAVGDFLAPDAAVAVNNDETPYDIYPTEEEALSNGGGHKVVDGQGNSWLFANEDAANDFATDLGDDAKVETVMRTVTFDDGTNKVAQEVVNGEPVEKPADPVRDGYTFKGWQTADGKAYDFSAPVTSNLTLTAAWEAVAPSPDEDIIEITFMVGDKVHVMIKLHAGDTLAGVEMPADPVWEGHTFVGWYAQVNEDGTVVESSKIDLEKTVFMTSTTLHAGFGTDGDEGPVTPDVDKPADKGNALAQTSDPTSVAPLVASAVAGIGVVAGAVVLRRRNK